MSATKICKKCKKDKSIEDFGRSKQYKNGMANSCLKCRAYALKMWKQANPEKRKAASRRNDLKRKYGLTLADYEALVVLHQGLCAICREPCRVHSVLSVDHHHERNIVRGLLCQDCNTSIGKMKDSPELLRRAADYVENDGLFKMAVG